MQPTYVPLNKVALYAIAQLHGVPRAYAETAAVSRGSSHVTTAKQRCNYFGGYSKTSCVKRQLLDHSESHTTRVQWVCSKAENIWHCEAPMARLEMRRLRSVPTIMTVLVVTVVQL